MGLFGEIEPVPYQLLDELEAQMEANRERLGQQQELKGMTRPRPQRSIFNATMSSYRRPEPAAHPRGGKPAVAVGWHRKSLRKNTNLSQVSVDQYFSGDRSVAYNLDFTYANDWYEQNEAFGGEHDMILPIDGDRFIFVKQFLGGPQNPDTGGIQGPFRHDIWCILIGGNNVKPIDTVPGPFRQAALAVFSDPNVWFTPEGLFTEGSTADSHPSPSLGLTHFPTAPACGYGITDSMRRFWEAAGSEFSGDMWTFDTLLPYHDRAINTANGVDPPALLFGTGSPANYRFLDLVAGSSDPHSPSWFREWWRLWWDELDAINDAFDNPNFKYIEGITHEYLRAYVPGAGGAPIFSLDYTNPALPPRYDAIPGSAPGTPQINRWWRDITGDAVLTFRRWRGGALTGNVHETFVEMDETTIGTQWSEPIEYPYPMKQPATVLQYGPVPIKPLLSGVAIWPSTTINVVSWSNGEQRHTARSQGAVEADGYQEIPFFGGGEQIVRFRNEGSSVDPDEVFISSFQSFTFVNEYDPTDSGGPIEVQYYYLTNGSWYMCPSTKDPDDALIDGNMSSCDLLSGPGGGSSSGVFGYPLPLLAPDWGQKQISIRWLLGKGFTIEDLTLPHVGETTP